MIEQYIITTTPKYNFPQPAIDTILPQRFLEQGLRSLRKVKNSSSFQINEQLVESNQNFERFHRDLQINSSPIPIKPNRQEITIAAIDTSSIKIGETSNGIIVGIRGAIVRKKEHKYRYTRLGPFVFHITEENKKGVYDKLERACFSNRFVSGHQSTPSLIQIPSRLAGLLERWMQNATAKKITNGLILLDGSLTSGTIDTNQYNMQEILRQARNQNNVVLAFSKMTTLRINGYLITDQLPSEEPPYLLETTGLRFNPPFTIFGDVYVARLSKAKYAFRLDIDNAIPLPQRIESVEKLVGNDLCIQGYPETLRLAHIMCTFTANEVLAMQRFVALRHGIQIIDRPDMHRLLFGLYGKGEFH